MGVLSALPIIATGNLCCCLWIISGGLVAAYVLQHNQAAPIAPGDGALVGLLAGAIGAVIQVALSIPINFIVGPFEREMLQRVIDMAGNMPPEIRDALERYGREGQNLALMAVARVFELVFWMFAGAVFSTLGGLLGAAIFRKPPPPPGVVDVPPSSQGGGAI
jgi:hypothetical protein